MTNESIKDKIVKYLFQKRSSKLILLQAIKSSIFKRDDYISTLVIIILSVLFSIMIGFSANTMSIIKNVASIFNTVVLVIFAVAFTGYTLFQALVSNSLLKQMLDTDIGDKPSLVVSNDYFVETLILNAMAIFINTILLVFVSVFPDDFALFGKYGDIAASLLIFIYIYFEIIDIWEMKSFVFNIYQLFNLSAGEKIADMIKKEDKDIKNEGNINPRKVNGRKKNK